MAATFEKALDSALFWAPRKKCQRIVVKATYPVSAPDYYEINRANYEPKDWLTPVAIVTPDGQICEIFKDGFTPLPLVVRAGEVVEIAEKVEVTA